VANDAMYEQMKSRPGFIAALDQSGGSTPGALRLYGIPYSAYSDEAQMFDLIHEMRVRIITAPAFSGEEILAAILFEQTMDRDVRGTPVPSYLWGERGVVPFLKVDTGLQPEADGVSLMKPIPGLDALLEHAVSLGIFGTKMRSTINLPSKTGVAAIAAQQFAFGAQIAAHGLVPILEPEVLIASPDRAAAEALLLDELLKGADAWSSSVPFMAKVTIPEVRGFYAPLMAHANVLRVVALSGGFSRDEACARLARNPRLIASFSRALVEGLTKSMSDADFDAALAASIEEIFKASTVKAAPAPT